MRSRSIFFFGVLLGCLLTSAFFTLKTELVLIAQSVFLPQYTEKAADPPVAAEPAPVPHLDVKAKPLLAVPATRLHPPLPEHSPPRIEPHNAALPFTSMPSRFSLRKIGQGNGPTLLVIGGIQGDEPGSFSAASLLSTQYTIAKGQVWVIPDLNFASILKRNRGVFGDMNRKFAHLEQDDPDYALIGELKSILLDEKVDLVLNLHDGSGFYRPTWENSLRNPNRWGQSVIIDQSAMEAPKFSELHQMAQQAEKDANTGLVHPEHRYHIRNTNTRAGDKEMEKSLSYFAVLNGKPAFGIEASKEFTTEFRSYYHMLIIESFMRQMGIDYTRKFPLSPGGVLAALNSNLTLSLFDGKVVLPLDDVRPALNGIPFKAGALPMAQASVPLLALAKDDSGWRIAYGNRTLSRLTPETLPFDNSLEKFSITTDEKKTFTVTPGDMVEAESSFMVNPLSGYRVNAIGAVKDHNGTEAGVKIAQSDFMPRYSVDKEGRVFRIEVYKDHAFCGMVLVKFGKPNASPGIKEPLTAVRGQETELGF